MASLCGLVQIHLVPIFSAVRILTLNSVIVTVWAMACALAPNYPAMVVFRVLQGFSSAGGSVTLGIVADMFEPEHQGKAVACKSRIFSPQAKSCTEDVALQMSSSHQWEEVYLVPLWEPSKPVSFLGTGMYVPSGSPPIRIVPTKAFEIQFWLQLIFGGFVQLLHAFTVPETKASVLMNKIVKKRRENGEKVYAPDELKDSKWNTWDLIQVMGRPVSYGVT